MDNWYDIGHSYHHHYNISTPTGCWQQWAVCWFIDDPQFLIQIVHQLARKAFARKAFAASCLTAGCSCSHAYCWTKEFVRFLPFSGQDILSLLSFTVWKGRNEHLLELGYRWSIPWDANFLSGRYRSQFLKELPVSPIFSLSLLKLRRLRAISQGVWGERRRFQTTARLGGSISFRFRGIWELQWSFAFTSLKKIPGKGSSGRDLQPPSMLKWF